MGIAVKLLPLIIGTALALQAPINASLGRLIGSLEASLVNFAVGGVALLVIVLIWGTGDWAGLRQAHPLQLVGGLLGLVVVLFSILAVPRLGAKRTFTLAVTAQLVWSVVLDHIGFMGIPRAPVNWRALVGLALVVAGVATVEWAHTASRRAGAGGG